jgi:hypothetical protein
VTQLSGAAKVLLANAKPALEWGEVLDLGGLEVEEVDRDAFLDKICKDRQMTQARVKAALEAIPGWAKKAFDDHIVKTKGKKTVTNLLTYLLHFIWDNFDELWKENTNDPPKKRTKNHKRGEVGGALSVK